METTLHNISLILLQFALTGAIINFSVWLTTPKENEVHLMVIEHHIVLPEKKGQSKIYFNRGKETWVRSE